ncbi:MAG: acetyl-CoA carboxylase biotin carboxyl carrier protein [Phycisphaerales bacterium]|nr:acetyl-CoA carboxylase biotin carboxyl carrier protein [Phycisphaerales bacterium]
MIDIRRLKELVRLMVENDLSELDLRDEQESVVLRRGMGGQIVMPAAPMAHAAHAPAPAAQPAPAQASAGDSGDDDGLTPITSPMVGTFYSSPDPESPAYVSAGSNVDPDTVVCIVEAMKVFSEIKAEVSGVIEKVLVKSGEPVEYGQTLFLVRGA